jgi:hypothetical protein
LNQHVQEDLNPRAESRQLTPVALERKSSVRLSLGIQSVSFALAIENLTVHLWLNTRIF